MKRRFFLIVLDGCGVGEAPDASEYSISDVSSNTLGNTARVVGGLKMPCLQRLGLGNITELQGVPPSPEAPSIWGRLQEVSKGKDTITGHWEMMEVVTEIPFPTYPHGFPPDIVAEFEAIIGTKTLGNYAASGTEIIATLGEEHIRTGFPIIYTSADSVFQVAAHEDNALFGLQRLWDACAAMRDKLMPPNHIGRVIARPFVGNAPENFKRTENRRDYPLVPAMATTIDLLHNQGKRTLAIGKISEIFSGRNIDASDPTTNNPDHCAALARALRGEGIGGDADFIFANLEDFDMMYGHRNDPVNFARLLEEFDDFLGTQFLPYLRPGDLVGITADHGNDPTTPSTDHSREYAPLLLFGPSITVPQPMGDRVSFAWWGEKVRHWLTKN